MSACYQGGRKENSRIFSLPIMIRSDYFYELINLFVFIKCNFIPFFCYYNWIDDFALKRSFYASETYKGIGFQVCHNFRIFFLNFFLLDSNLRSRLLMVNKTLCCSMVISLHRGIKYKLLLNFKIFLKLKYILVIAQKWRYFFIHNDAVLLG